MIRHICTSTLPRRALRGAAVLTIGIASAACGDTGSLLAAANIENVTRTFSVYALTGSANSLPAAYRFTTESLERPQLLANGALNFDMAFDITADGRVRFLPARFVAPTPPAGAPSIGLQRMTGSFLALERAPSKGFQVDSAVTVAIGETYTVQLPNSGCIYGEPFYAKITVDSILLTERRMVMRSLINRNCGFLSLTNGLPKD